MTSITLIRPNKTIGLALMFFVPVIVLFVSMWTMTFRFNAQLSKITDEHNAQMWKMTEEHNAQMWKMTEEHNAQLSKMTGEHNAQLAAQEARFKMQK